jgi:hypothetical protein
MRINRGLRRVGAWIRSAPGTYVWLVVLFITTVALHHMSPQFEQHFLRQRSTNIHELSRNPVRVLVASAFWIDGGHWIPYAFLYTVFLATLISEGALLKAVRDGIAPHSAVNTLDIGVSYALAGVIAVLTYRIAAPWRYVYLPAVLAVFALPLIEGRSFTDLGHFVSALIGLACYPLVRGRGKAWNPKETLAALRS